MQTTYSISYIPLYDKPESVTPDFSAFANFNIAKHSFWEKTAGDINVFLNTGSFPEVARAPQAPTPTDAEAPAYTRFQAPVEAPVVAPQPAFQAPVTETYTVPAQAPTAPVTPAAPVTPTAPVAPAPAFVPPVAPATTPTPFAVPAQPNTQPTGTEFGRAPRTFGGLSL